MNRHRLHELTEFVEFLGNIVNKNIEIVLHIIEKDRSYIAAIVNNHVSGRTKDAPLTDLAKSFVENGTYKDRQFFKNYTGYTKDGKKIQASTFFITSTEGELEAMICFNIDVGEYSSMFKKMMETFNINLDFVDIGQNLPKKEPEAEIQKFTEYYNNSITDTVYSVVPKEYFDNRKKLKSSQKMEIIRALHEKGLFNVKGTIQEISTILDLSVSSIYRYISEVEKGNSK